MSNTISDFGFCIVKDEYFNEFPSPFHMDNKNETRPHFLSIRDNDGIMWLVPISHNVEKYRNKICDYERRLGRCDLYYITKFAGEDRAFLIGNCIPITQEYIKKPYTISNIPYVLHSITDRKEILSRLRRYLSLVKNHKLTPSVDILSIATSLKNR